MSDPTDLPPVEYRDAEVADWIVARWTPGAFLSALELRGTFEFPALSSGLYSAALVNTLDADPTGYRSAWTRDNVHIANALYEAGQADAARRCAHALVKFMASQMPKMEAAIAAERAPDSAMDRPHIRFDGEKLEELPESWAHAQNDALGYLLWLVARVLLADEDRDDEAVQVTAMTVRYLTAIAYWSDPDSGHWEETRKVSASSIGTVIAGLDAVLAAAVRSSPLANHLAQHGLTVEALDHAVEAGASKLEALLPNESVGPHARAEDAALLFLIEPLGVVDADGPVGQEILRRTHDLLTGQHGVRRYRKDSYWAPDFRRWQAGRLPATDEDYLAERERLVVDGQEAQWALFDPILSLIYARSNRPGAAVLRDWHLRRSLAQLTGPRDAPGRLRCVEAYFLEDGEWVPNDHVPLLWTQANLLLALSTMAASGDR